MTATCPRCHHEGPHVETPAKPPHHLRIDCGGCSRFLRFAPKPGNEHKRDPNAWTWHEPSAQRLRTLPATDAQKAVIARSPKWNWVDPQDRLEACQLVNMILREAEAG